MPSPSQSFTRNCLLSKMAAEDFALLQPDLETIALQKDDVLEECDEVISHVVFPNSGLGSIMTIAPDGERIESGIFGREGMSGIALLMGAERSPLRTIMQVAGSGLRIEAAAFRHAVEQSVEMLQLLLRYAQTMAIQTSYTALAGATHPVEVRLARWLLMAHDRSDTDELPLTHDYLSTMLTVRRPSVTTALHVLEGNKLIRGTRGLITIRNRAALEEFADGSYGKPEAEYSRLVCPFFK